MILHVNLLPMAVTTNTSTNIGSTVLRCIFLFSFILSFITTKSATSFTCLPPTKFVPRGYQPLVTKNEAGALQCTNLIGNERRRFAMRVRPTSIRYTASSSTQRLHSTSPSSSSSSTSSETVVDNDMEDQIEAIQMVFTNYCDGDGLMTKRDVMKVPYIADLLSSGDLLVEEFDTIFDQAPKFPDSPTATENVSVDSNLEASPTTTTSTTNEDRIDIDSFIQIYRDIDDLFEIDDDDDDSNDTEVVTPTNNGKDIDASSTTPIVTTTNGSTKVADVNGGSANAAIASTTSSVLPSDSTDVVDEELLIIGSEDGDEPDPSLETELEAIYESICDTAGYITKEKLRNWDEVDKLIQDGLLGEDEFQELWATTNKSNVSEDKLDVDGFLSFNVALDDLFAFEDDEMEDEYVAQLEDDIESDSENEIDNIDATNSKVEADTASLSMRMIDGEGLSPDILFVALANADGLVGIDELQQWRELQEMITDGDVLESELLDVYTSVTKSGMDLTKLEVDGFVELYTAINNLFEDDGDDGTITTTDDEMQQPVTHKIELLDAIADLGRANELPCGLDATELEQREILSIVELLETDSTNMIRSQQGIIAPQELSGEWELIYSSSSAMKFNQGLTGLGGSVPNGQFSTLKQKLISTKFLSDVEYNERIEMNPSSASFDVTVTGTWDLRTSVSLFTGEPSIVMNVVPDRVTYGPTSTRADHWKSLGPMNMLDISYLDDNLRIMRGNTSIDTIFVFRRISPSNR